MIAILIVVILLAANGSCMSRERREAHRDTVKEMFDHGFSGYMKHAFPKDEINPLTCSGRDRDASNDLNWHINDILGNYSLTLIDALDSAHLFYGPAKFHALVNTTINSINFNKINIRIQVFEVSIRILGSLLSAHSLADGLLLPATNYNANYAKMPYYNGQLLSLAKDLAERLLPAFDTPTGLPWPRIDLVKGVLKHEVKDTCTAGAGTLVLEFGVLSRFLSQDSKSDEFAIFEKVARKATKYLWSRRSSLDLLGNTIEIEYGVWLQKMSGIGAGADSFYEYLLKTYILFGDEDYLDMFEKAYAAILRHNKDPQGLLYKNVDMDTGMVLTSWVDSLSAFFPGVQVLAGDLDNAIKLHLTQFGMWRRFRGFPERFDYISRGINIGHYPLRPELIESTYMLYQATKNPFYLEVGAVILEDLNNITRTSCGFASIKDLYTGMLDDRMESFFLAETLKYLYLLFDTEHPLNKADSNFVFTTEGHILPLPKKLLTQHQSNHLTPRQPKTCPPVPTHPIQLAHFSLTSESPISWLPVSIADLVAINRVVGLPDMMHVDLVYRGDAYGVCQAENGARSGWESESEMMVIAEPSSTNSKLIPVLSKHSSGYTLNTLHTVKLTFRLDATASAYVISRITVFGETYSTEENGRLMNVRVPASGIEFLVGARGLEDVKREVWPKKGARKGKKGRARDKGNIGTVLRVMTTSIEDLKETWIQYHVQESGFSTPVSGILPIALKVLRPPPNSDADRNNLPDTGCTPYTNPEKLHVRGSMVAIHRGDCTFESKAKFAADAGAVAVLIVNYESEDGVIGMVGSNLDGQPSVGIPVVMVEGGRKGWERIQREIVRGAANVQLMRIEDDGFDEVDTDDEHEVVGMLNYSGKVVRNLVVLI